VADARRSVGFLEFSFLFDALLLSCKYFSSNICRIELVTVNLIRA